MPWIDLVVFDINPGATRYRGAARRRGISLEALNRAWIPTYDLLPGWSTACTGTDLPSTRCARRGQASAC